MLPGPRGLGLAQEDTLVMRGDMGEGQRCPRLPQAEPVLVLPGLALTTALAHEEDGCGLLPVDLGERGAVGPGRGRGQPRRRPLWSLALTENQST